MCMKGRILIILFILLAGFSTIRAQQASFRSQLLAELGKGIGYVPDGTLSAGVYDVGTALGMPIIAEYDAHHNVTHLGFQLFPQGMKSKYSSDVYNFVERYFLEMYCFKDKSMLRQKLKDDKVMFTVGSIADIKQICDTSALNIRKFENKFYEVSWSNGGQTFLSIAFPIQYELLLGMPQVEISKSMYDMIIGAECTDDTFAVEKFISMENGIFKSNPESHYELESVNTCTYYYKEKDGSYSLIVDTLRGDLSATNVFHVITKCNNPIDVEQSLYGFNKKQYSITLQQWVRYCISTHGTIYTSIEEEYDDAYKVLVVVSNKDLGYNHLLSVVVPKCFISEPTALFKAKLNAFIPTHNVKNLYQQYIDKPKKKI